VRDQIDENLLDQVFHIVRTFHPSGEVALYLVVALLVESHPIFARRFRRGSLGVSPPSSPIYHNPIPHISLHFCGRRRRRPHSLTKAFLAPQMLIRKSNIPPLFLSRLTSSAPNHQPRSDSATPRYPSRQAGPSPNHYPYLALLSPRPPDTRLPTESANLTRMAFPRFLRRVLDTFSSL